MFSLLNLLLLTSVVTLTDALAQAWNINYFQSHVVNEEVSINFPSNTPETFKEKNNREVLTDSELVLSLSSCSVGLNGSDLKVIAHLQAELEVEPREKKRIELVNQSMELLSTAGLNTLSLLHNLRVYKDLANVILKNSTLAEVYKKYDDSASRYAARIREYAKSGGFGVLIRGNDKKLSEAGNEFMRYSQLLLSEIAKNSDLDEPSKQAIIKATNIAMSTLLNTEGIAAQRVVDNIDKQLFATKTVRDTAIGSGLIVAGIMTLGTTSSAGTAVLANTGSKMAAFLAKSAVRSAAGGLLAGGARLVLEDAKTAFDLSDMDQKKLCEYIKENKNYSDLSKQAMVWAAGGANIFGIGGSMGFRIGKYIMPVLVHKTAFEVNEELGRINDRSYPNTYKYPLKSKVNLDPKAIAVSFGKSINKYNLEKVAPTQSYPQLFYYLMGSGDLYSTGLERDFASWVFNQADNSLSIEAVFEKAASYGAQRPDWSIADALLLIHETLRSYSRYNASYRRSVEATADESARFFNKFKDIRGDLVESGGDGDHSGSWYRLFGMLLKSYDSGFQIKNDSDDIKEKINNWKIISKDKFIATLAEHCKPYYTLVSVLGAKDSDFRDRDLSGKVRINRAGVDIAYELITELDKRK